MNKDSENNFFHFLFVKEKHFTFFEKIRKLINSLGHTEKMVFWFFSSVFAFSGLLLVSKTNEAFTTEVPGEGGVMNEGIIGSARFINPLLAVSETDKALVTLTYSGLLKPEGDDYAPDLAESLQISEDGLVYNVKIRDDVYFHDGHKVTADDVLFTIEKAIDPAIKSPRKNNWDGVAVEKIDSKNIRFVLQNPYTPFLENLILGILPQHIWKDATSEEFPFSQWNIEPIGSGPFKLKNVKYNQSGIPVLISLEAFKKYAGGKPNISKMNIKFFRDSKEMLKAFESGDLDGISGLAVEEAKELENVGVQIIRTPMTRIFGAFFNQNHAPIFVNKEVRGALDQSLDKQKIVEEVLFGYGVPLDGIAPLKDFWWVGSTTSPRDRIALAKNTLLEAGWKENEEGILEKKTKSETQTLSFSISTSNVPELKKTAEIVKNTWSQLGAKVEVKVFEPSDLNKDVIKTRNYDALLFGEVIGRDMDFYPFWHSSQRNDPGLNIALYTNITADKLLENIRTSKNKEERSAEISKLNDEIKKDTPVVFIYAPEFIYIVSSKIKNVNGLSWGNQSDRFISIKDWYIETDRVWNLFTQK